MALSNSKHTEGDMIGNFHLRLALSFSRIGAPMTGLRILRLALSGALAGVALAGVITGDSDRMMYDILGASLGFAAVCTLKVLHFV
jgi:hypothetical protein